MKLPNKNQTFENFSVNDGNAWSIAALKALVADKKTLQSSLYLRLRGSWEISFAKCYKQCPTI